MIEDLKRVLARVQSDYEFYLQLRLDPKTVACYDLSADERRALSDPELLKSVLDRMAADPACGGPTITIQIQIPPPNLAVQPPPPRPPPETI